MTSAVAAFPVAVDADVQRIIIDFVDSLGVPGEEYSMMLEYITLAAQRNIKEKLLADLSELIQSQSAIETFIKRIEDHVLEKKRANEEKKRQEAANTTSISSQNENPHEEKEKTKENKEKKIDEKSLHAQSSRRNELPSQNEIEREIVSEARARRAERFETKRSSSPPRPRDRPKEEVPTTFTITLDQVAQNAVKRVPQLPAKNPAVKTAMQEAVGKAMQRESGEGSGVVLDTHVVLAAQQVPRCAFFPNCTKSDCPFFHPTEPCKKFPSCPLGDKCRYIHPEIPCKFGVKCARPNCNYTHPKKTEVPCRFSALCSNPKCSFFHPKESKEPCPRGFACDKKEICPFKHPKIECRYRDQCRNKVRCIYSHAEPCPNGASCLTVDCLFGHPSPPDEKDVSALSASLPKTPPQAAPEGDPMEM